MLKNNLINENNNEEVKRKNSPFTQAIDKGTAQTTVVGVVDYQQDYDQLRPKTAQAGGTSLPSNLEGLEGNLS